VATKQRRSFGHAAHSAFIFDTSKIELGYVARCTVGVAVPLLVALVLGYPAFGLAAAIGALSVGFASQQGVYRTRAAAMLWTAFGMAVSTAAGSLAAPHPIAMVLVAVAWGFAYGALVALGPAATVVGLNSCVALALASAYSLDGQQILVQSGLVLAGGLLQTLLLVAIWPMRRYGIERSVLRDAYAGLAVYARAMAGGTHALPDASLFQKVRAALADPQPFARRRDLVAFSVLQDEAERIRSALAALTADHYYWEQQGERAMCAAIEHVGSTCALVLEAIATALDRASEPEAQDGLWEDARHAVDTVNARPGARQAFAQAQALLGQLRAAWRSAGFPAEAPAPETPPRLRPHVDRWSDGWLAIRSNLNLRSPVGRHAVRLALALGLAMLFAQRLPAARGYWIPLTVVLILKPDFTATFERGFARIIGTLIGAIFVTALVVYAHPTADVSIELAIVFAALGYVAFSVNYALYTLTVTSFVIMLLAVLGTPEHQAVVDRVMDTFIGGALAAIAYLAFPTWESGLTRERLADLLQADRVYADVIFAGYISPAARDEQARRAAQSTAWQARVAAEASVDRMATEPARAGGIPQDVAVSVLAHSQRFALALLTLNAQTDNTATIERPALRSLARRLEEALDADIAAVRTGAPPAPTRSLRDGYRALERVARETQDPDADIILAETDLLVDSLNSLTEALQRGSQGETPSPSADRPQDATATSG